MASLAEELKLLSMPAPGKINITEFDDERTAARVISKDDINDSGEEVNVLGKSTLRLKSAILLAEQDQRYVGRPISRKKLSKLRGDLSENDDYSSLEDSDLDLGKKYESEELDENYEYSESDVAQVGSDQGEEESNIIESDEKYEEIHELGSDSTEGEGEVEAEEEVKSNEVEDNSVDDDEEEEENEEFKVEARDEIKTSGEDVQQLFKPDTDEVEKGKAVVHQIALWDSLLENRIRLQKMLIEVNKLPQPNTFSVFSSTGGSQIKDSFNNMQQLLMSLLHNLLVLQQSLYERNSDTHKIINPSNKPEISDSDEDIPSDDENEQVEEDCSIKKEGTKSGSDEDDLKLPKKRRHSETFEDYSTNIMKRHFAFEHFRDATIKKWNEKTRLASGKVNSKTFNSFDRSTLTQIKQILNDRERLIKRTQLKRSSYRVFGKMEDGKREEILEQRDAHLKDYDPEIFDDDDFYHQLLREFIERKSNVDPNDPIAMGRQWLEIQRLRSKVKRKVDTEASKGRRLGYDVHPKLVSFMAPQSRGTMIDSSRNELFSSLFGRCEPQKTSDIETFR